LYVCVCARASPTSLAVRSDKEQETKKLELKKKQK
jgi:hypothetical protein